MRLHRRQLVIGPGPVLPDPSWRTRDLGAGRVLSHSIALPIRESEHGLVLGIAVPTVEDDPDGWAGRGRSSMEPRLASMHVGSY